MEEDESKEEAEEFEADFGRRARGLEGEEGAEVVDGNKALRPPSGIVSSGPAAILVIACFGLNSQRDAAEAPSFFCPSPSTSVSLKKEPAGHAVLGSLVPSLGQEGSFGPSFAHEAEGESSRTLEGEAGVDEGDPGVAERSFVGVGIGSLSMSRI